MSQVTSRLPVHGGDPELARRCAMWSPGRSPRAGRSTPPSTRGDEPDAPIVAAQAAMLAVHRAMTAPRPPSRAISYRPLSDQTNYQLRALVSATLGDIQLRLVRWTSGTTATIADSTDTGIPFVAGAWYWLKLQTLGRVRPLYAGAFGGMAPRSRARG